ncbi:MAG: hypothetical protein H6748_04740 [Spirochaetaceae bacterium]|nr:hypothetical protein [Myxococcales bacterium]MCB9723339.1 hypothetical protein [Spirochaetaceae bacterium]HPG27730.1 hypothetical protein [Myxococcota bacterium]
MRPDGTGFDCAPPRRPPATRLAGLLVAPLAERIRGWLRAGKLLEEDLERVLSVDARALVDHPVDPSDRVPVADVEGLVALASEQLGGDPALVEWAEAIVDEWCRGDHFDAILRAAPRLVDAPGFVVAQAGERLLGRSDWRYEGGRRGFAVRLAGLEGASSALKSWTGALLARLASEVGEPGLDVRFEGVDAGALVVFGEPTVPAGSEDDAAELRESRLLRAALVA